MAKRLEVDAIYSGPLSNGPIPYRISCKALGLDVYGRSAQEARRFFLSCAAMKAEDIQRAEGAILDGTFSPEGTAVALDSVNPKQPNL